ncbi:nucleolar protein,Nop52-domain-containing protein [Xylaria sp. FL0933]|nr:nucleolar protein,Nop52-domain-containing protein [Xylaria sp. FL0933]
MAAHESNMPFIRNLASSDRKTRTAALESLRTFLSASATSSRLSRLDNLKLWKGLYYSLWMCDRPLPQQNLCAELAALLDALPDAAVAPWLAAFWETLGREWTGIDVLRLEKFMLLVRRVLGAGLAWVCDVLPKVSEERQRESKSNGGEGEGEEQRKKTKEDRRRRDRIDALLENLGSWPLETEDNLSRVPVGLRLHVLDIWVDEAEKLGLLDVEKTGEAGRQFLDRLGLLVEAQTRSTCKPVRQRAKEVLADDRLPWNADEGGDGEVGKSIRNGSGDKDSWDGFED